MSEVDIRSAQPAPAEWDKIVAALTSARTVTLAAHVQPDADALGSALAIGMALVGLGAQVQVSYPGMELNPDGDGTTLPAALAWLPGIELVVPAVELRPSVDVAVSCDVSSSDRLGELYEILRRADLFAAIDHHQSYTGFADVAVIEPTAPATATLALELIDRLGAEVTTDIATCLYAGLSTDTGSFRWAATDAEAHLMAARLHGIGIRHDEIARALYDERPFTEWGMIGAALGRAMLEPEALDGLGLAWTYVGLGDRSERGIKESATEVVVDALRRTAEAEVTAVVKESDDGSWRVSVRSRGAIDVGDACLSLGGGGHRCAGGFTAKPTEGDSERNAGEMAVRLVAQLRSVLAQQLTDRLDD